MHPTNELEVECVEEAPSPSGSAEGAAAEVALDVGGVEGYGGGDGGGGDVGGSGGGGTSGGGGGALASATQASAKSQRKPVSRKASIGEEAANAA